MSKFWREMFRLSGTTLAFSSAYHLQTDGQTEVKNRILETYLRCFVGDAPNRWVQYLHLAEFWYNTSFQSAIKMTPFEALYGRSPPNLRAFIAGSSAVASLDESMVQRRHMLQVIHENLSRAQLRMKSLADAHRLDRSFKVGDWVVLKLQPYQ